MFPGWQYCSPMNHSGYHLKLDLAMHEDAGAVHCSTIVISFHANDTARIFLANFWKKVRFRRKKVFFFSWSFTNGLLFPFRNFSDFFRKISIFGLQNYFWVSHQICYFFFTFSHLKKICSTFKKNLTTYFLANKSNFVRNWQETWKKADNRKKILLPESKYGGKKSYYYMLPWKSKVLKCTVMLWRNLKWLLID